MLAFVSVGFDRTAQLLSFDAAPSVCVEAFRFRRGSLPRGEACAKYGGYFAGGDRSAGLSGLRARVSGGEPWALTAAARLASVAGARRPIVRGTVSHARHGRVIVAGC